MPVIAWSYRRWTSGVPILSQRYAVSTQSYFGGCQETEILRYAPRQRHQDMNAM
ncbi:MAG TPA: hypothetical protein VIM67_02685 [Terriglobus sp.]